MENTLYTEILEKEFPYLNPDNSGEWAYGNCFGDSWFWEVPVGWRELFIEMCREINTVLLENKIPLTNLHVEQIKEKYGDLRFYYSLVLDVIESKEDRNNIWRKVDDIVEKYSNISFHTCIECGKPAKYLSKGWISPYCEDCIGERKYSEL